MNCSRAWSTEHDRNGYRAKRPALTGNPTWRGSRGREPSPRLMATPSLLSHRPGLVIVRGSRANVRDHEPPDPLGRTHSFLRRGLPPRVASALAAATATSGKRGLLGACVSRRGGRGPVTPSAGPAPSIPGRWIAHTGPPLESRGAERQGGRGRPRSRPN
jgi:hypothetical protein